MGKRFGHLGVTIRGIFYYAISPHELRPFANVVTKGIPNVITRTSDTIWRWLPMFIIAYATYRYVEYGNWLHHRKNPRDYANEVEPPLPKMCVRIQEPKPFCKKDYVYEEYECAPGEEPDEEFLAIQEARKKMQAEEADN